MIYVNTNIEKWQDFPRPTCDFTVKLRVSWF